MKVFVLTLLLFLPIALADEKPEGGDLLSESFAERQEAEKKLIDWAREKDSEKRAEELFRRYLVSEDPEEFRRLTDVLLAVHFEKKKEIIPQTGPGFIGISMDPAQIRQGFFLEQGGNIAPLPDFTKGVFIREVIPGTPAEKAGLQVGDIIVSIDEESIAGGVPTEKLKQIVGGKPPGSKILLGVARGEESLKIEVTLMNGNAVPALRENMGEARVDFEKADELLRQDYLRWLSAQRIAREEAE